MGQRFSVALSMPLYVGVSVFLVETMTSTNQDILSLASSGPYASWMTLGSVKHSTSIVGRDEYVKYFFNVCII